VADGEPIQLHAKLQAQRSPHAAGTTVAHAPTQVAFNRQELNAILNVYGRMVAAGEWRDYGMDFGRETATFAVYRRASEVPLYRIEKTPKLARKQGAFCVVNAAGLILKRGPELARVLDVFDKRTMRVVG
jgi:hypothetical protein